MSKISSINIRILQDAVVTRGVSDVMFSMFDNKHFFHSVANFYERNNGLTIEQLKEIIDDFYDFNEFGGLTEESTNAVMDALMPPYVQSVFIVDVQGGILYESIKLITELMEEDED